MLARIETFYLGILRVVILIVATIALLVAALAFVSAMPPLVRQMTGASEPKGPTLGQFIQERRLASGAPVANTEASKEPVPLMPPDAVETARLLAEYAKGRGDITLQDWQRGVTASEEGIPPEDIAAYLASLKHLAEQLHASKGAPLSLERVGELLQWHHQRFLTARAENAGQRILDASRFGIAIYAAGGAFFLFILITFTFLFVKIERSLRVVRTVEVEAADA